ncbi:MAG: DUF1501 domain-containing protein [Acidobacteria bacterium]|nr:DUF1501 domain-containing protein [Acidobacteriota bacterium]
MDFELSEEHKMIEKMVYDFARNEILPIIKQHDRDGTFPHELLPKMAAQGDKFSLLRSVTHPEAAHERGTTYMLIGYRMIPGFEYPGYGSVVAKERGWQNNMPPYVAIPSALGRAFSPRRITLSQ